MRTACRPHAENPSMHDWSPTFCRMFNFQPSQSIKIFFNIHLVLSKKHKISTLRLVSAMAKPDKASPKVTLRMFDPSDADDFMAWAGDARVSRFTREDVFTSREDAHHHIHDTVLPHPWYRAICIDNDDRRAVGSIWVDPGQGAVDGCRGSISYRLAHDYWGRGIATSALKAAVKVVFAEWAHLERVEAIVRVENFESQRVLEKAGFVREGVLRRYVAHKGKAEDMVMYSILSSEV